MREIILVFILTMLALIVVISHAHASDMVFKGYSETVDCFDKSERIEVVNKETGVISYIVKSPCEK